MTSQRFFLSVLLGLGGLFQFACDVKTGGVQPPTVTPSPGPGDDSPPPPADDLPAVDAAAQAEASLKAKVLTRMHSSSNIGDGFSFIEQFRSDLDLCSTHAFSYFESKETTIGANFSRDEFSASGTWSVRIDQQTQAVILVLNVTQLSRGEPFTADLKISRNDVGQTFLNNERAFVTEGDDLCN